MRNKLIREKRLQSVFYVFNLYLMITSETTTPSIPTNPATVTSFRRAIVPPARKRKGSVAVKPGHDRLYNEQQLLLRWASQIQRELSQRGQYLMACSSRKRPRTRGAWGPPAQVVARAFSRPGGTEESPGAQSRLTASPRVPWRLSSVVH